MPSVSRGARRLAADWVLPIEGPPIRDGALLIGADGRVVAAGPDRAVPAPAGVAAERFPGAALLPGLVNTHTHLELTGLDDQIAEADFALWIRRLRALKVERTPAMLLAAARQGIRDCWAAGVTTVADTGDSGAVAAALAEVDGSGIVYHEVFGPHPDQLAESMAQLRARVAELRACTSDRLRLGVSPHAPYTVSGPLYEAVARWATEEGLPMAVHLAESGDETRLLCDEGAFAEAWAGRGIPLPGARCSPVEWLDRHGVLGPETLCIHLVQVDATDVVRLAAARAPVAHCPRSNARHGHGAAPLRALLDAGLRVGVGTDSVASVAPLDLLAEARAAGALAGLGVREALALCTTAAARALGLEDEVGALRAGCWGDCVVIEIGAAADPEAAVLASGPRDVRATYLAGREVHR